jgi:hypothetical protein
MWWTKRIDYKTAGICPACLNISANFKEYDANNLDEYLNNVCPHCQSEALTIGIEKLEKFLKAKSINDLNELEIKWITLKGKFLRAYWNKVKRTIDKLKELKSNSEFV